MAAQTVNQDGKFAGKVAFVTGAANGIDRATALATAREGAPRPAVLERGVVRGRARDGHGRRANRGLLRPRHFGCKE